MALASETATLPTKMYKNQIRLHLKGLKGSQCNTVKGNLLYYRPISLTSVLVESIIKDPITKHTEEQALLEENQHGFLPSTASQI